MRFRSAKHVRWYAGGALLILALHFFGVLRPLELRVRRVTDGSVNALYRVLQTARTAASGLGTDRRTTEEFPSVLRERDQLKTRVALVEAENSVLRRELRYPERNQWTTIGADVIAKTTDIAEQALIINRGSRDGVTVQQIVFAEQGALVGSVIATEENRAIVRLLIDRQSRIGVLLAKNAKPAGIAEGGYGLGVRLGLIPPQEVIETGDLIVTNDVSEFMPRGLLVGRATNVGREIYEPFQHALIEPAIPYDHIKQVSIILKK
ncbi:MAG: rod shape-determining protein MreC [Candidatus Magasanikbacteria bacterium RIFCSPHIGHO2_02_FULL_50_9b]|uniref:Cell shape-determining protein MreC n=1 Tax=Candidatus Magasanikbacteria bacterium RIFCSPHIGHO2_02_FULL_50_9b TaxID=1798682 RepID=A0A1F6M908_9BACT|nr:MAG: rod shape-determining protein MreC [Candidatus Magasanikbacteria bacterium RIFCSPHIGHO2_02_FULL_50_9b]